MFIRQQEKFLSNFCVNEADAARKPRLLRRYDTPGVQSGEFCVGKLEQGLERVRRNTDKLERLHARGCGVVEIDIIVRMKAIVWPDSDMQFAPLPASCSPRGQVPLWQDS